ncbi:MULTISPECIES: UDP-glucose/GDP-mannose dehydrogenase family protein [unclassified Variovorax]|uniref:UDP-glucose dehydrogenase family protein n=1 Tax=unclassified Variovorax TaxID=663243 RepID=UPI0008CF057C|nr:MULTISPECIES: UDP-glucose/GDP-mannose dehydrogenase family protein [unclassified Variovorax]SEK15361.1 UDPglucose 6-dehydrogenase [Variovorax sp. OK202]SFE13444.1 UDPglucose 6-dehydrogenase [Variovorax sp. OK212]
MKVSLFGAGYVGLSFAASLAEAGHEVLCADADLARIEGLQRGLMPLHEPDLEALVAAGLAAGTLRFTADERAACLHGEVIFIVVNTPADAEGRVDLRHVMAVAAGIGRHRDRDAVVVCKSTAPVGTADQVEMVLNGELSQRGARLRVAVAANPEFLREGSAVRDCRRPDRVVIGSENPWAVEVLTRLYAPFVENPAQLLVMDRRSAELAKYAANAMLATRISFMNEMARVAEHAGADIEMVRRAIGADRRIGPDFLQAGAGYGGSCLAKDVRALKRMAERDGYPLRILTAVEATNHEQKGRLFELMTHHFEGRIAGKTIAVWGLAFKPDTDDMRDAPSLVLLERLRAAGARVQVYDPVAMSTARDLVGEHEGVRWCGAADEALQGADALALVTEWPEFSRPDFARIAQVLRSPAIFDGRNLYEAATVEAAGIAYYGIGRGRSLLR